MSRMSQVMQVGDVSGDIQYYIEDYAYTYLKKQKGREKAKYFLYGEKEENEKLKKLYIYAIAEKPKMEQTYFKDYYPLGFLKIRNDETFWITLKGQEQKMMGFYVFYAPNQAMQEYLVDHQKEEKVDKPEEQAKRQLVGESIPMKETLVPVRKIKKPKKNKEFKNEKFLFPIGGIIFAGLILLVLTSNNGQKKIEIFRQVISQTMSGKITETSGDNLIIEEKDISWENREDEIVQNQEEINPVEEMSVDIGKDTLEQNEESVNIEENDLEQINYKDGGEKEIQKTQENPTEEMTLSDTKDNFEEYIVKDGDTLAAICEAKYGSLSKINEICTINNIKNADYIAPGQKIYLP